MAEMAQGRTIRNVAITQVIGHDVQWHDDAMANLRCPECGFAYQNPGTPVVVAGHDDYQAHWGGRGDLIVIPMEGECGHNWQVCLGFHKGQVAIFARTVE